jgi:hypothetical protein
MSEPQYEPSGLDEFATLCPAARDYRDKWSRAVAEKGALEAQLAECREEAHRMVEAARSDANARWATACEEYGRCVPEVER